jgi:hypothetical protein
MNNFLLVLSILISILFSTSAFAEKKLIIGVDGNTSIVDNTIVEKQYTIGEGLKNITKEQMLEVIKAAGQVVTLRVELVGQRWIHIYKYEKTYKPTLSAQLVEDKLVMVEDAKVVVRVVDNPSIILILLSLALLWTSYFLIKFAKNIFTAFAAFTAAAFTAIFAAFTSFAAAAFAAAIFAAAIFAAAAFAVDNQDVKILKKIILVHNVLGIIAMILAYNFV